jgi:fructosamine-3-kinase
MIPEPVVTGVEWQLRSRITRSRSVTGGCINACSIVETNTGSFFLKWNLAVRYPGMFEAEARGLELLRSSGTVSAPKPVFTGSAGEWTWILLEEIETGSRKRNFWEDFGTSLAELHLNDGRTFGLDHDNYIGSLTQPNEPRQTWSGFYAEMRLQPQMRKAVDAGLLVKEDARQLDRLCTQLPTLFPEEAPSLLHGDLWSGNFLTGPDGTAWVIDPAVYYGHREMDLAMTRLFGGFDERFYASYHETYPLQAKWEERVRIAQLYPLLVHVNLFGEGYVSDVRSCLSQF